LTEQNESNSLESPMHGAGGTMVVDAPGTEAEDLALPYGLRDAAKRRRDRSHSGAANGSEAAAKDESRRAARAERRSESKRPRAPRLSQSPDAASNESAIASEDGSNDGAGAQKGLALIPGTAVLDLKGRGTARAAARMQKRQEAAASAMENLDSEAALGALNRHLNTMSQQVTAAHRMIGRLAAERDGFRQQIAEMRGVPVEQIVATTVASAGETAAQSNVRPAHQSTHQPHSPSKMQNLNYFGVDDFDVMRKRRQMFVMILAVGGGIFALIARQMGWGMPDNISRDSLALIPGLGNFMAVFLAGWMMYRVIRVASKGVRWVFPSEQRVRHRH
jgi:hypothetical protein